jgi:Na+-driven multidrug efflux pump
MTGTLGAPLLDSGCEVLSGISERGHESHMEEDSEELPYSVENEVKCFFRKGVPLGLAATLEWGAPPWAAMVFAGHTDDSRKLQSALGYARVFYNCTVLMVMVGLGYGYMTAVISGCVGANRSDRIPIYLRRSLLFTAALMLPSFVLQFFAGSILARLGVPPDICADVQLYCRWMVITASMLLVELHIEIIFVNLGYARSAMLNSLLTGLGVDVVCTYLFIYRWRMGMLGAALAQLAVKGLRLVIWAVLALYFGLVKTICVARTAEPLASKAEIAIYTRLALPAVVSNFAGWFIFELQILGMANIAGITPPALAAGAIWVQCESTLASIQSGWLSVISMRTLKLLSRHDRGAWKSYALLIVLSNAVVALLNIPLLVWHSSLSHVVSTDPDVSGWLDAILWVLLVHAQTRVSSISASMLFIPVGRAWIGVLLSFGAFYLVAAPIAALVALTDFLTKSVHEKLVACVGMTTIAQVRRSAPLRAANGGCGLHVMRY